jgi:hypothetical protein
MFFCAGNETYISFYVLSRTRSEVSRKDVFKDIYANGGGASCIIQSIEG